MSIGQYDYSGLCEAFINQSQSCGKTAEGRMSFNRLSIYSYSSLLATLDPANKVLRLYKPIAEYSNTSNRHARILVNMAEGFTIFSVIDDEVTEQLQEYYDTISACILFFHRAHTRKPFYKEVIIREFNQMQQFLEYTKLDKRTKTYKRATTQISNIFATLIEHKIL